MLTRLFHIGILYAFCPKSTYGYPLEPQADAIVAFRLGQLAGLEIQKIISERKELQEKIKSLLELLSSETNIKNTVKAELQVIAEKFSDERRTEISNVAGEVDIEDLIPEEDCVYTLTNMGYIKRQPVDTYQSQRRGGKGIKCYKINDKTGNVIGVKAVNENREVMLITTERIIIRLQVAGISVLGRITSGVKLINLDEGIKVAKVAKVREGDETKEEDNEEYDNADEVVGTTEE